MCIQDTPFDKDLYSSCLDVGSLPLTFNGNTDDWNPEDEDSDFPWEIDLLTDESLPPSDEEDDSPEVDINYDKQIRPNNNSVISCPFSPLPLDSSLHIPTDNYAANLQSQSNHPETINKI